MSWHNETEDLSDRLERSVKATPKQYHQNSTNRGNRRVYGPELNGLDVLVKAADPADEIIRNEQAYEGNPHHRGIDADRCCP